MPTTLIVPCSLFPSLSDVPEGGSLDLHLTGYLIPVWEPNVVSLQCGAPKRRRQLCASRCLASKNAPWPLKKKKEGGNATKKRKRESSHSKPLVFGWIWIRVMEPVGPSCCVSGLCKQVVTELGLRAQWIIWSLYNWRLTPGNWPRLRQTGLAIQTAQDYSSHQHCETLHFNTGSLPLGCPGFSPRAHITQTSASDELHSAALFHLNQGPFPWTYRAARRALAAGWQERERL